MAIKAKRARTIVEEVAKLDKQEIEFLFELIKNSMIPGKHINVVFNIINKLKNQHQFFGVKWQSKGEKPNVTVKDEKDVVKEKIKKTQQAIKDEDGEIWIED